MAKKSLADLQAQIEELQAQAAKLRDEEKSDVVERIREAIDTYGLTAQDLFGGGSRRGAGQQRRSSARRSRPAAYADGSGNVWGGRGPRPKWLREALKQGRRLEEFAAGRPVGVTGDDPSANKGDSTRSAKPLTKRRTARSKGDRRAQKE